MRHSISAPVRRSQRARGDPTISESNPLSGEPELEPASVGAKAKKTLAAARVATNHKRNRLVSFDYFRGIAISFIVAGHSYGPWVVDSFGERVLANMIAGGSVLFVFISGFFFHHIYYERFRYRGFLAKKAKYVLVPYLILSAMGIVYYISSSSQLPYSTRLGVDLHSWNGRIEMVAMYLWTGKIALSFWYVPFILIVFAISPVFMRYIGLSTAHRNAIFLVLLAVSMLIHRPVQNLSPLHSVLYFTPVYLLGIICSIHRDSVTEFINGKSMIIGLAVLSLSVLQVLLFEGYGNFHKEMFSYGGLDINIIQKIAMCFFFLSVFQKYESRRLPGLKLLASSSFAIFFVHPWVLLLISETGVLSVVGGVPGMAVFVMTVPLVLISSLLTAYGVKLALKENSRYVTGW